MVDTVIKPDEITKLEYGYRPRLRRTLEEVKLVVEDGRQSVVAVFKEGPVNKPDESKKELTITYQSPLDVEESFLCIWGYGLKPEAVSKIRQHMGAAVQDL